MNIKEILLSVKDWIEQSWIEEKTMLKYMVREPFIEIKRLVKGSYTSMLLFWFIVLISIIMWKKGIIENQLKIVIVIILLSYYYMFRKKGKWKEYYKTEFIEGKEIK